MIIIYVCAVLCLVSQSCLTLCDPMDCTPPGSSVHGASPVKSTRVDCHALLQSIFPTQGLNSGLLRCRRILYQLCHQESPRILEWAAYPLSCQSSQPRNRTGVSYITCGFFTLSLTKPLSIQVLHYLIQFLTSMASRPSVLCFK